MTDTKCKICRRTGQKLFLKGERCFSPKCPMVKRSYPPGPKGKRKKTGLSEFGKELQEKQKLKFWYGLRERQFKKYVKEILTKRRGKTEKKDAEPEDMASLFLKKLESRLDNVVFRLGLAASRQEARKLVTHKHFLVNGKIVNIPSFEVKKGDIVSVKVISLKKTIFQNLKLNLKKYQPPAWLELDRDKLEGKVLSLPALEEVAPPAEISQIFEFYSK